MTTLDRGLSTGISAYAIQGEDGNIANIILAAPDVIASLGYTTYFDVTTINANIGDAWSSISS